MSESLYLLSICLPLGAIVLVFGMRYFAATQQARARLANDEAYRQLFLQNGIPAGPPVTRLAHAKRYVIDELIRVQVVAGGFKGFVSPSPANYNGYVGGSRYNRLPRVVAYEPGTDPLREEKA